MGELGLWAGVMLVARDLELFEPSLALPRQGFKPLGRAAFDIGGRAGFYPLRFLGVELEGGAMPNKADGNRATMYAIRGHLVGQLGLWSLTPFVVLGGGALGVRSDRNAVGNDVDAAIHLGLGLKAYLTRYAMLRFDVRNVITARRGVAEGGTNTLELLLGFSVSLGRKRNPDEVRTQAPSEPTDRDRDGVLDHDDQCIDTPGPAPTGCPPGDRDGDGFTDDVDACVDEAGIAPDGCPDRDPDKDGIFVPDDRCPDVAETKNGFEDGDGCPDEVPSDVSAFQGTLEGISFDTDRDTITPASTQTLDAAVEALAKFPSVRVEISGHTDSQGAPAHNLDLSQRRADAVKKYLVGHGIDASRVETRGAGSDEPIDTNKTAEGRARNRRIEFRVLH